MINKIHNEDCTETMDGIKSDTIDLIITSPPYAGKRTAQYVSPKPDAYVEWFMERAAGMYRVLRPTGSFILNIKEGAKNGVRQTYVYELVLAMQRNGWMWVDEYVWHKTDPVPGYWPGRLKDGWERCYHFAKKPGFKFNRDAVRVPLSPSARRDKSNPTPAQMVDKRIERSTSSGFGANREQLRNRDSALPSNVISMPVAHTASGGHPATFPISLPSWFIKLLTDPGDIVYDPFMGSGTTARAAAALGRRWIGSEISAEYCRMAESAGGGVQEVLG